MFIPTLLLLASADPFLDSKYVDLKFEDTKNTLLANPEYLTFVILFKDDGPFTDKLESLVNLVAQEYHENAKFVAYNCKDDDQMCPDKESVPNITAYHPKAIDHADSQLILTKHLFTGDMSNLTMKEYIRKNAPFLGDILTIENLSEFMNFEISKLILFTEKTFVPLTFRALSSKFNGRLEFGVVLEKNEELSERFNVSSYPTLILIHGTDQIKYEGKVAFDDISDFVKDYQSEERQGMRNYGHMLEKIRETQNPQLKVQKVLPSKVQEVLAVDSRPALLYYYAEKIEKEWEDIKERVEGMVALVEVHVPTHEIGYAQSQDVTRLPQIKFHSQLRRKKGQTVEDIDEILTQLYQEYQPQLFLVDYATFPNWVFKLYEDNQLGVVIHSDEDLTIDILALASQENLKHIFQFAIIRDNSQQMKEVLNTQNFPTMTVFAVIDEQGTRSVMEYNNVNDSYAALLNYLQNSAYPTLNKHLDQEQIDIDSVWIEMFNEQSFHNFCVKTDTLCVVGLFRGNPVISKQQSFKNKDQMNNLKSLAYKTQLTNKSVKFGAIDAFCQNQILEKLDIIPRTLPAVIIYLHSSKKQHIFSTVIMNGLPEFEKFQKNVQNFPSSGKRVKKVQLEIQTKDCFDAYQSIIDSTDTPQPVRELYQQYQQHIYDTDEGDEKSVTSRRKKKRSEHKTEL